ncbi:MAG: DJ-1 family glyoxalase III [Tractidigestivibacter sp.]|jgi:4-methyl-5(b-hydroxyethyl)-thiazole monophosphate biosynthesis|uniref:DJ-1 family glyoxalase III n=1 Tax=Tractidigestivibacter sp. TaxID=2847320 RepID=UPI003D8D56C1
MFRQTTDRRVAIFVAEGLEEIEGLTVRDLLYRAGIPSDTVSIVADHTVTSSHEVTIVCERSIEDEGFSFDDYDMLVLPGGMPGTLNLKACGPLCDKLVEFDRAGKGVAAICAAPSILAELGLLMGRPATSNPNFQHVLVENGAILSEEPAVVDTNVITSKGMGTAIDFGLAIVRWFLGDEAAENLKPRIVLER